jgi:PKD repeat protein
LITSNNFGCKEDTLVQRFTTIQDPAADFLLSDTTGCGNTLITLTDASTPTVGLTLRWNFGDGDSSNATNPSHTFTNTSNTQDSTYSITLIVTASASGCSDTIVKQFEAFAKPVANFGATEVCEFKITQFTDSSIAGGVPLVTWDWDFNDGNTDTLQNPMHTYGQDGTYAVQLVISNSNGCTDSITKNVESYPVPLLDFTHDTLVCKNDSIQMNNSTTGAIRYDWDFGNGLTDTRTDPSSLYDTIGIYTIRLQATSTRGCFDSLSSIIQVIEAPQASFIPSLDEGCAPLEVTFNNTTIAEFETYLWDYGQGRTSTNPIADTIIYEQGRHDTTYFVQLIVSNQCSIDTFLDSILVHPTPVAIFETDRDIGCSPLNLLFSNNLTYGDPDSLIWNFGDGSAPFKTTKNTFDEPLSHIFTTTRLPSDYTIEYIAKNGCGSDTAYKTITVFKTVEAFFNTDTLRGCFPLTVNFTNSSRGFIDYAWDFGDGNVSNINNPSHTFTRSGTFTVKIFVTDSCSFDTFEREILIYPAPDVSFGFVKDSICQYDSINFLSTSNNVSAIYWDFGDGDSSRLTNPAHQFDSSGIFNVRYTAYSTLNNCPATAFKNVNILERPKATITIDPLAGCDPHIVNFKADSSFNSWTFSNGNISVLNEVTETFTSTGPHWAKLVSEYTNGCKDSTALNLVVHPKPSTSFIRSADSLCEYPVTIDYTNTTVGGLGYTWILGNGTRSTLINPRVTFTAAGVYNDTLIASSQFGCIDTITSQVKIYEAPIANGLISPLSGCVPLDVDFSNNSQNYINSTWYFGTGDSSLLEDVSYNYSTVGNYAPTLVVYGNANCTDTFKLASTVNVNPNPIADFDFTNISVTTTFTNYSSIADSYLWRFGDGNTTTDENPVHDFPGDGIFNTTLIASNNFGCVDSISKQINITEIFNLFVSNALSPDFGTSDISTFKPTGVGLATYHIYIYDTWGNLVWDSDKLSKNEPAEGWDGTDVNGKPLPQDVYVWKISATFKDGRIWKGKVYPNGDVKRFGTLTLIR